MTGDQASPAQLEGQAAAFRAQAVLIREEAAAIKAAGDEERAALEARYRLRARVLEDLALHGDRAATAAEDRAQLLRRADALTEQLAGADPDDEAAETARTELGQVRALLDPGRSWPAGPEAQQAIRAAEEQAAAEPAPRVFGRING